MSGSWPDEEDGKGPSDAFTYYLCRPRFLQRQIIYLLWLGLRGFPECCGLEFMLFVSGGCSRVLFSVSMSHTRSFSSCFGTGDRSRFERRVCRHETKGDFPLFTKRHEISCWKSRSPPPPPPSPPSPPPPPSRETLAAIQGLLKIALRMI